MPVLEDDAGRTRCSRDEAKPAKTKKPHCPGSLGFSGLLCPSAAAAAAAHPSEPCVTFRHIKLRRWMRAMRSGPNDPSTLINKPTALTNTNLPFGFTSNRRIGWPISAKKAD